MKNFTDVIETPPGRAVKGLAVASSIEEPIGRPRQSKDTGYTGLKETTMKKIAIASDHAGYPLKEMLKTHLKSKGYELLDFGTDGTDPVDYPDYIYPAAKRVAAGQTDFGIVIGGSGNGEAIVANKVRGVRCALCWNVHSARLARQHNDANMISIGARMVNVQAALSIVDAWLKAVFEGGRHIRRIEKIESV
jgi:ribose 5-phosphate isomerase B